MACRQELGIRPRAWLDKAAMTASFLCLVHCVALPVLLALLPSLSRVLDIPETFHLWMLAFAVPASVWALVSGRARHGLPLPLGLCGLALLTLGAVVFGEGRLETPVTVAGSLVLIAAHLVNWRMRHAGHARA